MLTAPIVIEARAGGLDALMASPEGLGRFPPVIALGDRAGPSPSLAARVRRIASYGYFVLAPDWSRRAAGDLRRDVDAWLDHLADARRVDDVRIGVVGLGAGADLALPVAAWRSERIAAVAAFAGCGFDPATAREIAHRINAVVRLGCPLGATSLRISDLENALCAAGVDFDVEIYGSDPDWSGVIDLLARTLHPG